MKQIFKKLTASLLVVMMLASSLLAAGLVQALAAAPTATPAAAPGSAVVPQAASATVTYWLYLGYPEQTYVAPETHQVGDTITVLNNHRDKEYVDHPEWYGGGYLIRWYCKQDGKFYALNAPYTITTESVDFYEATFKDGVDDLYAGAVSIYGYDGEPMKISTHTLKFAGDGVSEEPVTEYEGYVVELPAAPEGKSWTAEDGTVYESGEAYVLLDDVTLTAKGKDSEEEKPAADATINYWIYPGYGNASYNSYITDSPLTGKVGETITITSRHGANGMDAYGYILRWYCGQTKKYYGLGAPFTIPAESVDFYVATFTSSGEDFEYYDNPYTDAPMEITKHTLTYAGDGVSESPVTDYEGKVITLPDAPEGMKWKSNYDEKYYAGGQKFVLLDETTLTAEKVEMYTVKYTGEGVNETIESYEAGTSIRLAYAPERTGFIFKGWQDDEGKTYNAGETYVVNGDVTFTAQWEAKKEVVLTFAGASFAGGPTMKGYEGDTVVLPGTSETKDGYTFGGWTCELDGKTYEANDTYTLVESTTFNAIWNEVKTQYTVTFAGTDVNVAPMTVDPGTVIELPVVTRTGYTAMRWTSSVDGSTYNPSTAYTKTKYTVNSNVTLTMTWGFTYIFYGATPVGGMMQTVEEGGTLTMPGTTSTQAGKTFAGWRFSGDSVTYKPGEAFTATVGGSFTAVWEDAKLTYTVTFAGEGVSVAPMTVEPGTEIELPVVTRAGYTIMGWVCSVDGKTYNPSTAYIKTKYTVNEDVTFTAKWGYTVMFQGGGSVAGGMMQTVEEGGVIKLPEVASTPAGKTFTGWKCSVDSKIYQPGDEYTVNSAVTFTAQFDTATYTVKYTGDGVTGSEETIAYNTKITLAAAPTRSGYTFKGWLCDVDETVYDAGAEYTVKSNVTFTAQWESAFVTVRFMGATVSGGGTKMGMVGGTITVPKTTETRAGYEFGGWTCALDGKTYQPDEKYTLVSDTTFEAVWNKVTVEYTVKYTGDGVEDSEVKVEEGTEIDLPAAPEKTGYNFKGWLCSADETVYAAGAKYTVNSDVTFTAQWEIQTFTVTFVDETGKTVSTLTKNYGETLAEADYPAVPEKEGYTGKWEAYSDPITKDITVKLTYTKDPTDKDALKAAIAEAEALAEADYTAETWAKLAEELKAAKAVNADEDALQSAIDKAVAALKAAIEALEKVPEQGGSKSEWYVGDVNLDGKINSLDYLLLKRKVIGTFVLPEDRKPVADINGDGKINSTDYMLLKRAVLEMFVLPKEPVVIEVANPDVTTND